MRVRWTLPAAEDLEHICDFIAEERPQSARRVAQDILAAVKSLSTLPNRGRPGRVEGTRELVLTPLPFVAIYEVEDEEVRVLRVLHGAQRWPE